MVRMLSQDSEHVQLEVGVTVASDEVNWHEILEHICNHRRHNSRV